MYVVHLPTSRNLFITRQMNTVNIRIVPINRVHRGGLVIMSEKETDKTWHRRKKDKERDWQREYRTGTKRQRLRETKEDTHSHKESEGGKKREWQIHRARGGGVEIMTERRKLQDIKRDRKLSEDMDRRGGERQWERDSTRQRDKQTDILGAREMGSGS